MTCSINACNIISVSGILSLDMNEILVITLLLISGSVPSIWAQCNEERALLPLRRAVYDFSTDLLTRSAQEKENHFVISTLSIWALLSCTSLGATDTTLNELKEVLRLHPRKCFNNQYLSIVKKVAANNDNDVEVIRSSFIYVDDKFPILKTFESRINKKGLSTIKNMAFDDSDEAAQKINEYVSQATRNTIDEVVSPGDIENSVMIIIDSIFFNGKWQKPFDFTAPKISPFYNERGLPIGNVNIMFVLGQFRQKLFQQIEAEVLELPYGKESESRYSMLVFLPVEEVPLYRVIENLSKVSLTGINVSLQKQQKRSIMVKMPRFKIDSDLSNLKELLADMGLRSMFDSAQARFSDISDESIYVSNFIQKAHIEVTENGTVASAATKAEFGFRSTVLEFTVNKPFLFMIVDKKYDISLFAGAYSKPSVY